jgi:hypothetical protein
LHTRFITECIKRSTIDNQGINNQLEVRIQYAVIPAVSTSAFFFVAI